MSNPSMSIAPTQWQDGICSCFNDGAICAQTAFCHICTASSIYAREQYKFASSCDCGSCCLLWCCSGCMGPVLMWLPTNTGMVTLMNTGLRRTLVQRFGIQGESVCESCLLGCCCNVCTMCQVQREMNIRGQHVGGLCASPAQVPAAALAPTPNVPMGAQEMQPFDDPAAKPQHQQQVHGTVVGQRVQQLADWRSTLCGCEGAADCCEAWFCSCCVLGHMAGKLNEINGVAGATGGQNDCAVCCCSCLTGSCPCCCGEQLYNFMMRRELVERYGIATESICKSAMCVCFCSPCVVAQSRREMGFHGEFPGGLCMKEMPAQQQQSAHHQPQQVQVL